MQIHKLRKILIILKNDSSDSNHSSTFIVVVLAAFTSKKRKKKIRTASKINTQPSSEYCKFRKRIILIL